MPETLPAYAEKTFVKISCNASGLPEPDVKWIRVSDGYKYPFEKSSSSLVFNAVDRSAAGHYSCEANNSLTSTSDSAEVTLTVHCKFPLVVFLIELLRTIVMPKLARTLL